MKITNPNYIFEEPTQVKFIDPLDGEQLAGIAYKDEVICGCCGAVYGINEVKIEKELPWIDLTKEIGGDEI